MIVKIEQRALALRKGRLVLACVTACQTAEPEVTSRLDALLRDDELARAGRFRFSQDRISFIYTHALARAMLSTVFPRPPRDWRFVPDELGRPRLLAGQIGDAVCLSLSHTRGLAACALGVGHSIGIDAENYAAARFLQLDGNWLTDVESASLHALAPTARGGAAVELWTLKEAAAEAIGLGLHQPLGNFGFTRDPPRLVCAPPVFAGTWSLMQMRPTTSHIVTVAARSRRRAPRQIVTEVMSAGDLTGASAA